MIDILDKKPADVHIVSASQVTTWNRCQRRWGFKYIDKLPDPVGRGAIFGSAVHKQLERYFESGTQPDTTKREGRLAQRALESGIYPAERTFLVEEHFVFHVDGVVLQGFVDLIWSDSGWITINDHKTSSDPVKYGLNEETLPDDIQSTIYALWALDRYELDRINLQWSYMQSSPPSRERARPKIYAVKANVDRAHVEKQFRLNVLGTAKEITQAKANCTTGNELKPDPRSCGDFGKACAFTDHCILNRDQKLTSVFGTESEENMGETLKEMLARKRAAAGGAKLPPPRVNSPEHKAGVAASQEVSKAVGQATGGPKASKETSRAIANATANETDPAAAKAAAEEALGTAEADRNAKGATAMKPNDLLLALFYKGREGLIVSYSKAKATAAAPYVAGRTGKAMTEKTLIRVTDLDDGTKHFYLTGEGVAAAEKLVKPTIEWAPAMAPTFSDEGGMSEATPEPSRTDDNGKPTTSVFPPTAPDEITIAPTPNDRTLALHTEPVITRKIITLDPFHEGHAAFFRSLLSDTDIETKDAVDKFDAYAKRFPMGGAA